MGSGKDKIVIAFAKRLKKNFSVQRLLLFGSRATGNYLNDSDYDFLIVSKDFERIHFLDRIPRVIKKTNAFFPADFLCYTPQEFEKKAGQIGIVSEAVKTGIQII